MSMQSYPGTEIDDFSARMAAIAPTVIMMPAPWNRFHQATRAVKARVRASSRSIGAGVTVGLSEFAQMAGSIAVALIATIGFVSTIAIVGQTMMLK